MAQINTTTDAHTPLLTVSDYRAYFHTRRGVVKAVDGVTYSVKKGETVGIVGESGSGKSVLQLSMLGLLEKPPLRVESGSVVFEGRDLLTCDEEVLRSVRGDRISVVFQEPMTSLNPYLTIGAQLIEPLVYHRKVFKEDAWKASEDALSRVGIADTASAMDAYPHEFSGGMRQRVMIAMALTTSPKLLIADEPTTALDVTVQAQILDLLKSLRKDMGMSIVLITHDLGVVAGHVERVLVMYAGKIVEQGNIDDVFYRPGHPYTRALLRSTPRVDVEQNELPSIPGTPPDPSIFCAGCPFAPRCEHVMDICRKEFPPRRTMGDHESYCHLEALP
jgi:oligopeptide/dipeptide ABC transporter ATP-binding protein